MWSLGDCGDPYTPTQTVPQALTDMEAVWDRREERRRQCLGEEKACLYVCPLVEGETPRLNPHTHHPLPSLPVEQTQENFLKGEEGLDILLWWWKTYAPCVFFYPREGNLPGKKEGRKEERKEAVSQPMPKSSGPFPTHPQYYCYWRRKLACVPVW